MPTPDAEARDPARLPAPLQVALEVVGVEPFRAEVGVDERAVGHGSGRREAAAAVARVVGRSLPGGPLPQDAAARGVERHHLEGVLAVGAHAVGVRELLALHDVLDGLRSGNDVALDGRRQEDAVAPHDGRRVAAAGDGGLPEHVLRRAPLERHARVARDSLSVGAAPLGPVRRSRGGRVRREQEKRDEEKPPRTHQEPPCNPLDATSYGQEARHDSTGSLDASASGCLDR